MQYTVHEAKTNLSRLIQEACNGKEVIIARGATPVVKLIPLADQKKRRMPGLLRGQMSASLGAFDPLSEEELKDWGLA